MIEHRWLLAPYISVSKKSHWAALSFKTAKNACCSSQTQSDFGAQRYPYLQLGGAGPDRNPYHFPFGMMVYHE
jgi:hypothetical protein